MYTEQDRAALLEKLRGFMEQEPEFEGLLLLGSGAEGFRDIYSDIDLMTGCFSLNAADEKLYDLLLTLDPVYLDRRNWGREVQGWSAYFENGLSVDISLMPTAQITLRSPKFKVLFSKTSGFEEKAVFQPAHQAVDDRIHHQFCYALRRCEVALLRHDWVYGEMMVAEGRQLLLLVEAAREGKCLHQFKNYGSLDGAFLKALDGTYPQNRTEEEIERVKEKLLALYLETVENCPFLTFDPRQLKLLGQLE